MKTSTTVSLSMFSLLVLASSSPVTINTPVSPHSQEVLTTHPFDGVQNTSSHSDKQTNTMTTNITKTTSRAASLQQVSVSTHSIISASTHSIISATSGREGGTSGSTTQSFTSIQTNTRPKNTTAGMVILFLVFFVGLLFLILWLWRPQDRRWARDTTRATVRRLRLWRQSLRREGGAEECASDDGSSLGGEEMGERLKVDTDDEGQTERQSSTDGEEEEVQKERVTQIEKQPHNDIMIEDDENQEDGRDLTIL